MTPTPGWQKIPEHTITLRGNARGTSVVLVADEFIPNTVIGFHVSVSIPDDQFVEAVRWRGQCGMYSSLGEFRTQMSALRAGEDVRPCLSLDGVRLVIYHHRCGVRTGLCVSGQAWSRNGPDDWFRPAGERKIGDQLLLYAPSSYCVGFAFQTSLVDPP